MTARMVCVIDGDNVAFAMVGDGAELKANTVRQFRTSDFPTFTDALQNYTRANHIETGDLPFGLAVAGVARGDIISLANCRWYISVSGIRAFLGRDPLIINDFAATAWSLAAIDPRQLKAVGAVAPRPVAPGRIFLVIGTGAGLGMATLIIRNDGGAVVLESEGGHASYAPQSEREDRLLAYLRRKCAGHVSYERVVSNAGLQNIHSWLTEQAGRAGTPPAADQIVGSALRGDPVAKETVEIFAAALGAFAGSAVLTTGAWDGVLLVGSLLRQMLPLLEGAAYRGGLVAKGRMRKALEQVPTSFADSDNAGLAGAAAALAARERAA
jgi:glucokinase